ncbi:MAG: Bcr/CflA family multidrug efflux MFS transporter [Rubritepida sp.]|nr:Bcr/CflA family multidrug efflux MFS transporter [Rubritepida sp.]
MTLADPAARRGRLALVLGVLAAFGPLSIDMYLPALPTIGAELGGGPEGAQLTLAAFFLGMAAGQLLHGPLADRFGRRRPLFAALVTYTLASALCALATGIGAFIALRLLQALAGCAGMVIARAVVRDLSDRMDPVRLMARLMLVMGAAPILAPLIGGWIAAWLGWRAIFWALALVGLLALLLSWWALPETLPPERRRRESAAATVANYLALLRNTRFMGTALASGCALGGMFAFIAGSPFVFITLHGIAPERFGWFFGAGAAGVIACGQLAGPLAQRFGRPRVFGTACLGLALAGAAAACAVLLGAGFWPLYAALFAYLAILGAILPLGTVLAIAPFPHMAGTASALLGTLQFGLGALAGVLLALVNDGSAMPMAVTIAAAGLCAALAWAALARAT